MLSTIPSTETTYKSINLFSKQLNWDKIKGLYKIFACDKFDLFLILPKRLIFAPATLHALFILLSKFNLFLRVNPGNFTDLDNSIVLLFFDNWLMDCVFTENHELKHFPGLVIIWLPLNYFHALLRSDSRFSITSFTDLAQLHMVLLSSKLQIPVFLTNHNMSFKKILKNYGLTIESCGTSRRIFNHELKWKQVWLFVFNLRDSLVID